MVQIKLTILIPRGKHEVCRTMECNESLDESLREMLPRSEYKFLSSTYLYLS
jgi:hypothetical protein